MGLIDMTVLLGSLKPDQISQAIWNEGKSHGPSPEAKPTDSYVRTTLPAKSPGETLTTALWTELVTKPQAEQATILAGHNVVTAFARTSRLEDMVILIAAMPPELRAQILLDSNNHAAFGLRNRGKDAEVDAMMADLQKPARPAVSTETVLTLVGGSTGNPGK